MVALADSRRDHPREYGENDARIEAEAQAEGSSPRIRGEYDQTNPQH